MVFLFALVDFLPTIQFNRPPFPQTLPKGIYQLPFPFLLSNRNKGWYPFLLSLKAAPLMIIAGRGFRRRPNEKDKKKFDFTSKSVEG